MASSPQAAYHSGLEVAPPQVVPETKYGQGYGYSDPQPHQPVDRTVCGVRPATFWLLLALLLVILAAGIGGGVGGTLAVNNAKT